MILQAEELLKELAFDYDTPGILAVIEKLKAALSKMPDAEVQPSAHLSALQAFSLTAQVSLQSPSWLPILPVMGIPAVAM
jgi:hypothetical protein